MDVDGTYSLQHLLSNWSLDVGFHHPAPTLLNPLSQSALNLAQLPSETASVPPKPRSRPAPTPKYNKNILPQQKTYYNPPHRHNVPSLPPHKVTGSPHSAALPFRPDSRQSTIPGSAQLAMSNSSLHEHDISYHGPRRGTSSAILFRPSNFETTYPSRSTVH